MASGSRGMAGGQAIDLASVGQPLNQTELEYMHIHKTGALIRAAALLGAYCAENTSPEKLKAIDHYSQSIGLAFQVIDDILDSEADTVTLGKTAGKDAQSNKPTYVTILGLSRAKALAKELYDHAIGHVSSYGSEANRLVQLAEFITHRSF
jgi:farnesyl diphosphate synthase